jgi:opacity protein-like surface antigen
MKSWSAFTAALIVCLATCASAQEPEPPPQDTRTQYPVFLANSYFTVDVGRIGYVFSGDQLEPGFRAESVDVPRLAVRVDLFGHRFTKNWSAQVTYMRPARFVAYHNVNGDGETQQVTTAYAGLTLVWDVALNQRVSAYGEGGLGITSRSGFDINKVTVLQSAHYAAGLVGAGLAYHATPNIDVVLGATYSPGRKSFNQPSTRLFTTGIRYHMRPLPDSKVEANRQAGYAFPENIARLGYTTNLLTYGVNNFFSQTIPIFWGGNVETRRGFTLDYQRNVFHTEKRFAFDLGASASYWKSNGNKEIFRTLSFYPLFRFFLVRTQPADLYFAYSLAGPSYVSATLIDGRDTGERFTFQDFMGVGGFFGKSRRMNAELGIKHYSNGNIFTRNASIKIPLTLTLGWAF